MQHFQIRTAVTCGHGALQGLCELSGLKVMIITDAFMASTELMKTILDILHDAQVQVFDQVQPDPCTALVTEGVRHLADFAPDAVIAFGGGSPIDTAKAIVEVATKAGFPCGQGLWVIPTTSGTGSEVTSFAIITDDESESKMTLVSEEMTPVRAILDPEAVRTAPARITAATGMDALSHCYEAILSTNAWTGTDALAEKAIEEIVHYLPRAFANGDDMEARGHMHDAACLAGMAFENAGLGIVHSMSHAMGARFHKTHGVVNTLLMPNVFTWLAGEIGFGRDAMNETALRLARIGRRAGVAASTPRNAALGAIDVVRRLRSRLQMPENIAQLGVDKDEFLAEIPEMCEAALHDACTTTSPRQPSAEDLAALYRSLI